MEILAASTVSAPEALTLSDYQFPLPPELIAQIPAAERDQGRLLVLDRHNGGLTHTTVRALPDQLRPGDLLVVNDTRVLPARIFGRGASGGAVELLLVRRVEQREGEAPAEPVMEQRLRGSGALPNTRFRIRAGAEASPDQSRWCCLVKPARRLRAGAMLTFPDDVRATVAETHGHGRYTIAFVDDAAVRAVLHRHGEMPLPPYIRRPDGPLPIDQTRYQTIFASIPGAIAAPTAGPHFTSALLDAPQARVVQIVKLTLHVGPGTFLPVRSEDIHQHIMEPEWCDIPETTAAAIRQAKLEGRRVVAVGTTTTRALESAAAGDDGVRAGARWADRFIVPGFQFRVVDALFTNFHLPGSTLLLLVSALAGRDRMLAAYAEAIRRR